MAQTAYVPMIQTRVVNMRKEPHDVYIGRGSIWGNPYKIGQDGTRTEVIDKYIARLVKDEDLLIKTHKLRGQRLGCFCKPEACHGDFLAYMADNWDPITGFYPDGLHEVLKTRPWE